MPRYPLIVLALLIGFLAACGDSRTPEQKARAYRDTAQKAAAAAQTARTDKKPKAAEAAAATAEKAAAALDALLAQTTPLPAELPALQQETRAFATAARLTAAFAAEEAALAAALGSLKARAYRTASGAALRGALEGLALAADQAAKKPLPDLPEIVQKAAGLAAELDEDLTGRPPGPGGTPDWPAIAVDLRRLARDGAPQLHLYLALGFALTGQDTLALVEIEQVDAAKLPAIRFQPAYHIARGMILHNLGCKRLGERQLETLAADPAFGASSARELLAATHLLLAYMAYEERDYRRIDLELARALQAWPDHPLVEFLTGERMVADGQYEKAAKSLETAAAGTKDEWLANAIAARARAVRDQKGAVTGFAFDAAFIRQAAWGYVKMCARDSAAAKKTQAMLQAAQDLSQQVLGLVPGMGK